MAMTIIIFVLEASSRHIGTRVIYARSVATALLLVIAGSILGIVALFGIFRHGRKGILAPAIIGIILNGLLVLMGAIVR